MEFLPSPFSSSSSSSSCRVELSAIHDSLPIYLSTLLSFDWIQALKRNSIQDGIVKACIEDGIQVLLLSMDPPPPPPPPNHLFQFTTSIEILKKVEEIEFPIVFRENQDSSCFDLLSSRQVLMTSSRELDHHPQVPVAIAKIPTTTSSLFSAPDAVLNFMKGTLYLRFTKHKKVVVWLQTTTSIPFYPSQSQQYPLLSLTLPQNGMNWILC